MTPIGPYNDFAECVAQNSDKANPEAFCAWLEHQSTGKWPSELQAMPTDAWEVYREAYSEQLNGSKSPLKEAEKTAHTFAIEKLQSKGWENSRIGWIKQYAAPKMSTVANVRIFASGTWTDSVGTEREWADNDLDDLVKAFNSGLPGIVPLKAGHTPDTFNSQIAEKLGVPVDLVTGDIGGKGQVTLGRMATLERRGSLLIAAFERVPEPIAALIESGLFSTISVEIEEFGNGDFKSAITAVAMLGAEEPAVEEATLDRALVFGGKREGAVVLTFASPELSEDEILETEFSTLKDKIQESIKGMRGAPLFRTMMAHLGTLFNQLKRNRSKHESDKGGLINVESIKELTMKDLAEKFQMGEEELLALATTLGLGEGATIQDILASIEALKAKAGAGAAAPPEQAAKGEFQRVTTELQAATKKIAVLEHSGRIAHWTKRTLEFKSIPGTPDEIAAELTDIEESQGKEKAETHFTRLQSINQVAFEANKNLGVALKGAKTKAFEEAVSEYQKAHPDTNRGKATKAIMKSNPELYQEYKAENEAS